MYDKQLTALERVLEIMDRLRKDCPWDREQTHKTIRDDLIEETYEVIEAIDNEEKTKTHIDNILESAKLLDYLYQSAALKKEISLK